MEIIFVSFKFSNRCEIPEQLIPAIAFVCACILKWLDRRERALYIGIRDKNRIFEQKVGRPPEAESSSDMAEATRMAQQVLGSARSYTADV